MPVTHRERYNIQQSSRDSISHEGNSKRYSGLILGEGGGHLPPLGFGLPPWEFCSDSESFHTVN